MNRRRTFLKRSALGAIALGMVPGELFGAASRPASSALKLSLAQWSLHRALQRGALRPEAFPEVARDTFGIPAVEYVNQFYQAHRGNRNYWRTLRRRTDDLGVRNILIMVDDEGLLGHPSRRKRSRAVSRHMYWVEAARILGCHSIRVNAFGKGTRETLRASLEDGLGRLSEAAWDSGISVLVENHGLHTSDAGFISDIIKAVGHPGLGTLPDFGNWCLNREWGSTQNGQCSENYDPVRGVAELLPYAKGVSAKAYDFTAAGEETLLPYRALLQAVKDSGYSGHLGIEYEGTRLDETEGIRATRKLIETIWPTLD